MNYREVEAFKPTTAQIEAGSKWWSDRLLGATAEQREAFRLALIGELSRSDRNDWSIAHADREGDVAGVQIAVDYHAYPPLARATEKVYGRECSIAVLPWKTRMQFDVGGTVAILEFNNWSNRTIIYPVETSANKLPGA